jgi:Voltage gated chloride channel
MMDTEIPGSLGLGAAAPVRPLGRPVMILLSILAGGISGLGAVLFRDLISFVHNLFFLGTISFAYNANEHTAAGPWGLFTAFVPVAGAAGGIAATFNTPIGGILFAVELILNEVSTATLVPVAICTVTATYVSRFFFGIHPSFVIPTLTGPYATLESPQVLLSYAALGALMGGASALFVRVIYKAEDLFTQHSFKNPYLRHMSAMLVLGVMMVAFMRLTGRYAIEGVGYSTVQDILRGGLTTLPLLLLLFVAKIIATSLTLGSGGRAGFSHRRFSSVQPRAARMGRLSSLSFQPLASGRRRLPWPGWLDWSGGPREPR